MSKKVTKSKLTPKQEIFCLEYLKDLNASAAAERAGYKGKSPNVAGSQLLARPEVALRIQELMNERANELKLDANEVLRELLLIAKADIMQAFGPDGKVLPITDMPEPIRRAIAGVEVTTLFAEGVDIGEKTKLRFWDKPKALELLAKHLKLLTDKIEHSGKVTLEDLVAGQGEDGK